MSNPLLDELQDTVPAASIALPSLGRWYQEGIFQPDTNPADIEVRPIGIMSEQKYRDPWLLVSGKALPALVKQVCPSVVYPEELSEIDIEAILIVARMVSYGDEMIIEHKCQNPKRLNEGEKTFEGEEAPAKFCTEENKIPLSLQEFILRYEPITDIEPYTVHIDALNQTVFLRPMPYKNSIEVVKKTLVTNQKVGSIEDVDIEKFVMDQSLIEQYSEILDMNSDTSVSSIVASIHYVKGAKGQNVMDPAIIREWLEKIPPDDAKLITDRIRVLSEKLRKVSEVTYNCPACGYDNSFILQMDPQRLFSQAGASKAPKTLSPRSSGTGKKQKTRLVI